MKLISTIFLVVLLVLGFYKLLEILIPSSEVIRLKRKNKELEMQNKILIEGLNHLNKFFAEFTYKTIINGKKYKAAPKKIYKWLDANYDDWYKQNYGSEE